MKITEKEVRSNLYLDNEAFDSEWKSWKKDIMETLRKNKKLLEKDNVSYCLEIDISTVTEYFAYEENKTLNVLKNVNGLIIYEVV